MSRGGTSLRGKQEGLKDARPCASRRGRQERQGGEGCSDPAGPAEAYRQMLGYQRWKDRGRLFVTGVDDLGAMVGNEALRTAEKMGQEA